MKRDVDASGTFDRAAYEAKVAQITRDEGPLLEAIQELRRRGWTVEPPEASGDE